ncbi:unnamed protein product, partial [Mesorhabditis spiculigera]
MRLGQGYSLKPRKSSFTWISLILCLFRLSAARDELPTRDAEKGPYFCGANSASAWGSYFMTLSCDQDSINSCCAVHDSCYATCILPQMECDEHFCNCLKSLPGSTYCRNLVHASHCSMVQFLGHSYICPAKAQPPFNPQKFMQAEMEQLPVIPKIQPLKPFVGPLPFQYNRRSEYMPSPMDQFQPHHVFSINSNLGDPFDLLVGAVGSGFSWLFPTAAN